MSQEDLSGLRYRERRARELADIATDISVRIAHLGVADIYKAQIADMIALRPGLVG